MMWSMPKSSHYTLFQHDTIQNQENEQPLHVKYSGVLPWE